MKSGNCPEKKKGEIKCTECNKVFALQSRLNRHLKSCLQQKTEVKTYKCLECDKDFPFRSRLISHLEKKHVKQKFELPS